MQTILFVFIGIGLLRRAEQTDTTNPARHSAPTSSGSSEPTRALDPKRELDWAIMVMIVYTLYHHYVTQTIHIRYIYT